ncbi:phage tail tape measure protein [Clostridium perfringens]
MEIFKLFGSIMVKNDDANKNISKTEEKAEGLGKKLLGGIGTAAKWGAGIAAAAGTAAVALGTVATKSAMDFQAQMSNVATLLDGDVNKRIGELGETVKKLSIDTGTSTDLLTDGLYQVISAFGDTADSMSILETASKGAKAGNASVTDSVNLLAAVTKGYGDTSAEAASKASDLAFLTVKLGQTSFPELASSMGKVIPLASTMKVSQEELFGAMATLTGVTGNTAEVTTQLRATIQGMLQPTTKMSDQIKKLGYENGQAMIESLGLHGTLDKLKESVNGNEIAFSELFGSVEAKNAVLALTGAQVENFTEKTNAMKDAIGATDEAFKRQTDNVKSNWAKLKNHFDVMMISLGEKFLPLLNNLLKWVESKMPLIQSILESTFNVIGNVVQCVGGIFDNFLSGAESAFGGFTNKISEMSNAFNQSMEEFDDYGLAFKSMLEVLFGPIGDLPIFEEIGKIISAINEIKNRISNGEGIGEAFRNAFEWRDSTVGNTLLEFIDFCSSIFESVKSIITTVIQNVGPIISGLATIFSTVISVMSSYWQAYGVPMFEFIKQAVNKVAEVFNHVFPIVANIFKGVCETINNLWMSILQPVFIAITSLLTSTFLPIFNSVFNSVANAVMTAFNFIGTLWNTSLKPILDGIINFIGGVFSGNWSQAWNGICQILNGIWGGIKTVLWSPIEWFLNKVSGVVESIVSPFRRAADAIGNVWQSIRSKFKLPHFTMSGSLNPLKWLDEGLPKIGVEWYAKGGIMHKPTIFGMNGPNAMVGGEAGPEAVAPIETLMDYVRTAVAEGMGNNSVDYSRLFSIMVEAFTQAIIATGMNNMSFYVDKEKLGQAMAGTNDKIDGLRMKLAERGLILE